MTTGGRNRRAVSGTIVCPRATPATLVSVEGSCSVVYAFGVGLANFAAGRSRLPRQIAADVAEVLPLMAWYGATGNLALAAGEPGDVAQRLAEITGTAWAVIPARDLTAALGALEAQPARAFRRESGPHLALRSLSNLPGRA